jgi:hypothetical protein
MKVTTQFLSVKEIVDFQEVMAVSGGSSVPENFAKGYASSHQKLKIQENRHNAELP